MEKHVEIDDVMKKHVEIDNGSGFCFGVTTAIRKAEEELANGGTLYCLGDIVHNNREVERLEKMGLVTINHEQLEQLHHVKVLLRAHGEPPETYELARRNGIEIIDATCPVVLRLQKKIKQEYLLADDAEKQIVIYGKNGHAEVLGLVGQTAGKAIVIEKLEEAKQLDFHRSIRQFAAAHELILFVSGKKSSNGKVLFNECLSVNPNSHLIDNASEVDASLLEGVSSIGICGATSTPKWLMEEVEQAIKKI